MLTIRSGPIHLQQQEGIDSIESKSGYMSSEESETFLLVLVNPFTARDMFQWLVRTTDRAGNVYIISLLKFDHKLITVRD